MGYGQLIVKVSEGGGTLPVKDAVVTISGRLDGESSQGIIYTLTTDESGLTETVTLEAPDFSLSQRPSASAPYTSYDIKVTKPGYITAENAGTQIFDDITAIQYFSLMPEAEFSNFEKINLTDTGDTEL